VLAAVVVTYQSRPYLEPLLDSLLAEAEHLPLEIVVVDSHSSDGGPEFVEAHYTDVRVMRMTSNWGFAAGCNLGARSTSAGSVLFLNPDVIVLPGSLSLMVGYLKGREDVGVLGCRLVNPDGSLQLSCREFYTWRSALLRRTPMGRLFPGHPELVRHLLLDYDHDTPREVDWVLGTCLLCRRRALDHVGGMDDRFFLYFEDVDLCYRMHRHGWKVLYYPDAGMIHHHVRHSARGWSRPAAWTHLRSMIRFHRKHGWSLLWRQRDA
jgi:N-acetylglucosaminyl-diphospho-decaprenol L-rhamnosyltransferase